MRSGWWRGLAIACLTALPVLLLAPFPTQDGPAHLYAGYLFGRLRDIQAPVITHAFEYSSSAVSTWTVHGMVSILLRLLPVLWVEKVLVLGFVAALFFAFIVGAGAEAAAFFPLCALPLFAMSFVLRMGFHSFCLSMPLALLAVGVWTGGGAGISTPRLLLAGCLLALIPFFHVLTAGWAFALLGAGSIGSMMVARRTRGRELVMLALASIPSFWVVAGYPQSPTPYTWERLAARVGGLLAGGAFVGAGRDALWWSAVPSVGLLALGVLFLRDEVQAAMNARPEALRRVVVAVVAFLLALFVPEEGAGGAYIGVRCNLLFFLLLLLLLRTWRLPARLDAVLSAVFLTFSVVHLSSTYALLKPSSAAEREICKSAIWLQDHTTALVVVAGEWTNTRDPTLSTQIRPLLHAGDLLGVGADRTIWSFYEGELPYFPVNFKRDTNPFGVLFDETLFGWDAPRVHWEALPTWQGGVEYVGVWDEPQLLRSVQRGAEFREAMCAHYEEVYRSNAWPWVIYHLRRPGAGGNRTPRICGG
jgi:hypothetical protein